MKWIFSLVLFCLAATASAQSIYKCRDAKGGPVYQSDPCPEAEKRWDTERRNYTWEDHYKRQAAEESIAKDRRTVRARNNAGVPVAASIGSGRGGVSRSSSGSSVILTTDSPACAAAKAQRASVYKAAGLNRSFNLSRAMDDAVYSACK